MVARNVDGVLRLARCLGLVDGPCTKTSTVVWLEQAQVLTSPITGTFHAAVQRSESVARGQVIGHVTDFAGTNPVAITAPFDGVVLYVIGSPAMAQGEPVAFIGRVRAAGMPPVRKPTR
jgi:predicted deacylase